MLFFFALAACTPAGLDRVNLDVEGTQRNYYLHVPEEASGELPLVIAFHGGGPKGRTKGKGLAKSTGLSERADTHGFLVAYPSSYQGNWEDGRDSPYLPPEGVSDLAFVDALIEDIQSSYSIDPHRIYATGVSNGGFFSQRLGCERTEVFAAIAPVIGSMAEGYRCEPTAPLSVLMINGTGDPIVPWEGGEVGGERGGTMPIPDTLEFWVQHNQCGAPTDDPPIDRLDDGTSIRPHRYSCAQNTEVELIEVVNGGHGWPGKGQYLPKKVIGTISDEIQGADEVWGFLEDKRR